MGSAQDAAAADDDGDEVAVPLPVPARPTARGAVMFLCLPVGGAREEGRVVHEANNDASVRTTLRNGDEVEE